MHDDLRFQPIERQGTLASVKADELVSQVVEGTRALYERVGFETPWIGYLAYRDGTPVGTCGFKGPIEDGRVELAYFTFPEFEGRGVAMAMARWLVERAREHEAQPLLAAQTLPERNASHRILEKLGFVNTGTVEHDEDGTVIEWQWRG